jgi:tetratricopeptide (TPR) repeat protein
MLLVTQQLGNPRIALEKIQAVIDLLPSYEKPAKLILLGERWAQIGDITKARAICDALQESSIDGDLRTESEFFRATLDELSADPRAENDLIALSQKEDPSVKLRANIRLAAYYSQQQRVQEAQKIFYSAPSSNNIDGLVQSLAQMTSRPIPDELLPVRDEVLKSFTAIARILPTNDAERVMDWIDQQSHLSFSSFE